MARHSMGNLSTLCAANSLLPSLPPCLSGAISSMWAFAILSVSPGTRLRLVDPDDSLQTLEISRQDPPNTISAEARGLRRGVYRVRWQVLASYGHITRGEIPFTLKGKNLTQGSLVPGPGLEPGYSAPKADVLPIRRSRINNLAGPRSLKLTHS